MSGRVPLGRLLELFQHLEKFHQHRVTGWRLPGPLLRQSTTSPCPGQQPAGCEQRWSQPLSSSSSSSHPRRRQEGGGEKGQCLFKQLHAKPLPSCFI